MTRTLRTILERVERGQITPEEGHRRMRALPAEDAHPVPGSASGRVAVVGMSARYAGASSTEELWRLLEEGRSAVSEVPGSRWDAHGFYDPDPRTPGRTSCVRGGFVEGVDLFDPLFFNLSGREAEAMDPQQRLFLEGSWNALEDAGYAGESVSGRSCGVYVGAPASEYTTDSQRCGDDADAQVLTGNDSAILAARISYLLNLRGPSICLNTACSSSLVAIHLAARAIASGECEMALAGGVCLFLTPGFYISAGTAGMLSEDGECFTFDHRANGFVPGEGVGVVVLKDLDAALRDGDSIRGVILGSAVNQDGRTNGITAPSAQAQHEVQVSAYRAAGVAPDTISMVEAHGTGTALGDPIEVDALTRSFGPRTSGSQRCVIGSVKTNIGHTGQAAGVAGVIKVLLAFEHEVIPPTLNFERANPRISLEDTPFRVAAEASAWPAVPGAPRRAAVSSYGYSGTNAHVVLEEPPRRQSRAQGPGHHLFLVSAKTDRALHARMRDLAQWLDDDGGSAPLEDVAFTLHVGRRHFPRRRAFVSASATDLSSALRAAADSEETAGGRTDGTESQGDSPAALAQQASSRLAGLSDDDPGRGEALRLAAAAYQAGGDIDPQALYPGLAGRRVPLPTYPYDRERYWLRPPDRPSGARQRVSLTRVSEDGFVYQPEAADPLVAHHRVGGATVLSAMASVEVAAAAAEASGHGVAVSMDDLQWHRPLSPLGDGGLLVRVTPSCGGCTVEMGSREGPGSFPAATATVSTGPMDEAARLVRPLDVKGLRERLTEVLGAQECRQRLRDLGIEHGEAYQVLREVRVGERQVLAYLEAGGSSGYRFHPFLLDGALQGVVGLATHSASASRRLPRGLAQIRRLGPLPDRCVAHLRLVDEDVMDVDVADSLGNVRVALRGLRVGEDASPPVSVLAPVWTPTTVAAGGEVDGPVLVLGDDAGLSSALSRHRGGGTVVTARWGERFDRASRTEYRIRPGAAEDLRELVAHLGGARPGLVVVSCDATGEKAHHRLLRTLVATVQGLSGHRDDGPLGLRLVCRTGSPWWPAVAAGLSAAARTLLREDPEVLVQVIGTQVEPSRLLDVLLAAPSPTQPVELVVDAAGETYVRDFVEPPRSSGTLPVRTTGCYVVSGGAGALGRVIGAHLASRGGTVVLLGRRAPQDAWQDGGGKRVHYYQADVSRREELAAVLDEVRGRLGPVRGVVHAAGVLRDGLVRDKSPADMDAVLAGKVDGARLLDELTAADPVDFMVLCSSAVAVVGNPGQVDYAFANGYLDGLAVERAARGRPTVSIGWPAWASGGMAAGPAPDGHAITDSEALACLDAALSHDEPHLLVLKAGSQQVSRLVTPAAATPAASRAATGCPPDGTAHQRAEELLTRVLAEELRIPAERIARDDPLDSLGIDSVMVLRLSRRLEEVLGPLPKTLFFEYGTLAELAGYLTQRHADRLAEAGRAHPPASPDEAPGGLPDDQVVGVRLPDNQEPGGAGRQVLRAPEGSGRGDVQEDVAVIGIAGRYPLADDLDQYWDNLVRGRDCITEIPPERWPLEGFLGERGEPGKSYSRWGGFLSDVDMFDPVFFGIAPREADMIDPQERLFLETAWHTLEDAGYPPSLLGRRPTGVFVGVMYGHYQLHRPAPDGRMPISSFASVANRVSYVLDLHGPSIAVDTMCSSALTAIHLAVASLNRGECDTALAGGVNLSLHPDKYRQLSLGGFASSDGRCRSFGQGGDGYVPAEGVGAVLLKPLGCALEDGDHIHAVIRGSAINHGGRARGYTVPSPRAQAEVIGAAMDSAGVTPADIDYVEAHGTGTALGDPIEVRALGLAYGEGTGRKIPVGSAKSSVGHLESAAGIGALTKVVLQLRHRALPPTLHAETLNPGVDLSTAPLHVQREAGPWVPGPGRDRLTAGISSFGAGGANAHLVVSQAPSRRPLAPATGPWPLLVSARSEDALRRLAARLAEVLHPRLGSLREVVTEDVLRRTRALLGLRDSDLGPQDRLSDCGLDEVGLARLGADLADALDLDSDDLQPQPDSVDAVVDLLIQRDEPRLRARLGFYGDREVPSLADAAYTLQVGREAMPYRLAVVASTHEEAVAQLRAFGDGGSARYLGHVGPTGAEPPGAPDGDDVHARASAWVRGADVEWTWDGTGARRVPLTLYPFARERHWLGDAPGRRPEPSASPQPDGPGEEASTTVTGPADPVTGVEDLLRRLAGETIGLEPGRLDPAASLVDYGFDSLTMKTLSDRISRHLGIDLPPTVFFEHSGVRGLAAWLVEEYGHGLLEADHATGPATRQPRGAQGAGQAARSRSREGSGTEPIAVIGMSGRFPGSEDVEAFWANLRDQRDLVTEVPPERWDWRALDDPELPEERRCPYRWGAFLDGVDEFDPLLFGISPAEAQMMDPQQRLLLQTAWATFESAGYRPSSFAGQPVGLFVGMQFSDYQHLLHEAGVLSAQAALGNEHSIAVNRISYLLDLRGPSEPVNTACSSSLVAVHRAVQSLRRGESTVALAGGIALNLSPHSTVAAGMMGLLSPDGRCKTLDGSANGYVKGEGVGLVMLKPLGRAVVDQDQVLAVIRGTGVGHGGRAASLTAPNASAQSDLIRSVVAEAGVEPDSIGYLELHGTGTELGDPIEINGITSAFQALRAQHSRPAPIRPCCGLGSVKTNIGHLEPASGIAGLIKVIQAIRHRTLPGMAHLDKVNPYVRLDGTPFYIATDTQPWARARDDDGNTLPLRAGVSSFGFGGVNAHVLVEEHRTGAPPPVPVTSGEEHAFVLSARTQEALRQQAARLADRLDTWEAAGTRQDLAAVAYTLLTGREQLEQRAAVVAGSVEDLRRGLRALEEEGPSGSVWRGGAEDSSAPGSPAATLARQWVEGLPVEWQGPPPARVSLPTYPFERRRYWFTAPQAPAASDRGQAGAQSSSGGEQAVREALRAILMDRLGLEEQELEDDRELRDLGVDSILNATIASLVQERFHVELSVTALAEHSTVSSLSRYIFRDLLDGGAPQEPGPPSVRRAATAPLYPPELVPVSTGGAGQPSFWVHGASGHASGFDELSRALGPDYPLYAFQARGTDGYSMPHLLEEMVDHYVSCVRMVQPHGPYVLGGYSFGGLIAMEMARRLSEAGETIRHLVMFDTYPAIQEVFDRHQGVYDPDFLGFYLVNYLLRADEHPERVVRPHELEHVPAALREQVLCRIAEQRGGKHVSADDIYRYLRGGLTCSAHAEGIYETFEMRPYDASDVLFFRATDGFTGRSSAAYWRRTDILGDYDYLAPWQEVVTGSLNVVELDNDHLSMLAPPTLDVAAHHIAAALRHPPEPDREEYSRFRAGLEAVTDLGRDVLAADLGGGVGADGTTRAELAEAVGVGSSRALGRLFDALVDILLREGYVTEDGGRLHRTERLDALDTSADAVSHRAATVTQCYAQASDYLSLLVAAQQNLRPVLSGVKQGVDVLMPGGSMNLVEDLYKKNVQADFYNALVGECVSERARRYARRYPHSTLQVLEAGAGTGATTDVLLRGLEPQADRVQYYFTDIGDFFVAQARRRYADRRNVRFCVHDIERPAEEQGIEPHSMDLVVASNVLHATRDVGRTLRSCARLLKAGGVLVINELVHRMDYNTLTFGLTEGWWLFEDPQRRIPGSPLLTAAAWREALREAGFCHVEVSGVPGVPEGEQAQCVIVAARGEAGALDD